jgi:hypothetical protein
MGWLRILWLVALSCLVTPCSCCILPVLSAWELTVQVLSGWMGLRLMVCGSIGALVLLCLPHVITLHIVGRWTAPGRLSPCGSYLWLRALHTRLWLRRLVCVSLSTLVVLWLPNSVTLHTVSLHTVGSLPAPGHLSPCCSFLWRWVLPDWAIL